jgi:poly(3-hydroxybutyrate) depolymerase
VLLPYSLFELQKALWAPMLPCLRASASTLEFPGSTLLPLPARHIAAACDLMVRYFKHHAKPGFNLTATEVDGQRVAVTETVVLNLPFCRPLHFERATMRTDPVVLVVAPLSGHHATLLRDTVNTMLPDFDVYVTDWIDARQVPLQDGSFSLDDYVAYVRKFLGFLGPAIHVLAVCQSTVPVLAAVSLMGAQGDETPRSMTLMGGPIDARRAPTTVNEFATGKPAAWFAHELIDTVPDSYPGAGRRVYPGFLQHAAFVAMSPERHLSSHLRYWSNLAADNTEAVTAYRRFYDEYDAVLDMTAEYYLDTIKVVFKEFRLARGNWQVHGEDVRPCVIATTALITVEGERDDVCGSGQTHAAHDLCTGIGASLRERITVRDCGHYGIFSGGTWRTSTYPRLREIIYQHEGLAGPDSATEPEAGIYADEAV